jgi:hypothetical protein
MLLLLGTPMDMSPLILLLTPILLRVVNLLGIDPVHFGMIMMVNLGSGLITPPVGSVLFVGAAVSQLKIGVVTRAMTPFFIVLFNSRSQRPGRSAMNAVDARKAEPGSRPVPPLDSDRGVCPCAAAHPLGANPNRVETP